MDTPNIIPILKKIHFFQELSDEVNQEIVRNIKLQYFPSNYRIFSEGDTAELLYIIKTGKVRISKMESGQEEKIALLGPGDFFGEMAFFSRESRNASAQTVEESEVFTLSYPDFLKLIESTPEIASKVSSEFLKRVKENTKRTLSGEK